MHLERLQQRLGNLMHHHALFSHQKAAAAALAERDAKALF